MFRSLTSAPLTLATLVSLAAADPASAQILKCRSADGTIAYSQGDSCPQGATPLAMASRREPAAAPGEGPAAAPAPSAALVPAAARAPAGAVPDDPLPLIETGIPAITQLAGRFGWLDAETVALTTYSDPPGKTPWMVRRVVAFDVPSRAATTLVARGFVDCTNPSHGLVSLEIGDLESRFAVGSTAPPAVPRFDLWNPAAHALVPAPAEASAGWHPHACLKTAPEDLAINDLSLDKKPLRYLQPEHGVIAWGLGADGHPMPPSLDTGKRRVPLPLSINDVSHDVRYLPFAKAYQLAAGSRDTPLVTMDLDGHVTKRAVPTALARALEDAHATGPGKLLAVRGGAVLVQAGPARNGGGLYLVQGEQVRRVWCTATPATGQAAGDDACRMSQPPQVSPDGCSVAFDAKPATPVARYAADPTFKVIEVCSVAEKQKAARVSSAR